MYYERSGWDGLADDVAREMLVEQKKKARRENRKAAIKRFKASVVGIFSHIT